ncbi:GNAT family N-acetyltransferase [Mammaliicoccus sciuri]|uniref:GNAT family N-acetyltransferase n=1 Tax=Mammaliicoccus sciuri TaxID=1296 RepID=UPI00066D271D|nr:GNAT family N-acetyltransferase [Mammaliicoccus sciuri]
MIRDLSIHDAKNLSFLNKEQLGYTLSIAETKKNLSKLLKDSDHHYFIGYEDKETHEILGYIHAEVYESIYSEPMFNILALAVSKKHNRQGIGKKLICCLEKEALKRNYQGIRLNSSSKRIGAHAFYEANNFINDKDQKRFIKLFKSNI